MDWHPCPWNPDAVTAIVEGLELEVHLRRSPGEGFMWLVYGYVPRARARYPDVLDHGYSGRPDIGKRKAINSARRMAAPVKVREARERKAEQCRERRRSRRTLQKS